ncbi:MAG: DASS family sodium-coupled anion symporter [Holophaga sp.]|jgi:citrate:succinate antiporter/L-tartrate/succinate antiporter
MKSTWWNIAGPLLLGLGLALVPTPGGLTPQAWHYFAVFAAVILALILEPIPAAAIGMIGIAFAGVMRYVDPDPAKSISWALAGFSDRTVWLIFGAFVFSIGYAKSGLGRRIALVLVRLLGRKTLGLGYAVLMADLVLAPGTPSNTARAGGTIFPVIRNIPDLYGSAPGPTARRIGSYIMWVAFATTCITSSMFITSLAPNAAALAIVKQTAKLDVTWTQWFMGFLPVAVPLLVLLPLLVYWLYPPEIKASEEVPSWAAGELRKMGPMKVQEIVMALLVVFAVFLWIVGSNKGISLPLVGSNFIDATGVVLVIIAGMIVTGVVGWDDILGSKGAWNVLVWFATLVALADGLNKVGFVAWAAKIVSSHLTGISPIMVMVILVAFFFFIHYMFASLAAHTAAVLPVVLASGMAVPGMPVKAFAMMLCFSLGIMGVITPYATGPAPVFYAGGFISRKAFWGLGLVFGVIFLAALLLIGIPSLTVF